MNNFQSRLVVGVLYVLVSIACLLSGIYSALAFGWLIQLFCLYEFYQILKKESPLADKILSMIGGAIFVFPLVFLNQNNLTIGQNNYYLIFGLAGWILLLYALFNLRNARGLLITIFGWTYISVPFAMLIKLGNLEFGERSLSLVTYQGFSILSIFILIWASDTFAYLAGRKFGKTPLAPSISPKKTVEGFVGGLIGTLIIAVVLFYTKPVFYDFKHYLVLGLICCMVGTMGDLFESWIKRKVGIKDSGTLLGGHGGFLDRFDSVIFVAPIAYFYLNTFAIH
ncbi:MAG: phosphatidate cytidylyltransferase [Flavobacteriales bacterium]|nr:phosphatidate cytidylyltransferase [Flavobacteriales bacterium]